MTQQDKKEVIGVALLVAITVAAAVIPGAGMLLFPLVIIIPFATLL